MKRFLYTITTIALVIGAAYLARTIAYPTYYYRFKLEMTVDDAGVQKSASSVIEIKVRTKRFGHKGLYHTSHDARGVAPILDLGDKGTLIAALTPENVIGGQTGKPDASGHTQDIYVAPLEFLDRSTYRFKGPGPFRVTRDWMPQFIWLPAGASHPGSAKPLVPSEFAARISHDVRLVSLEVSPTDEAVHEYIEDAPAWLVELRMIEKRGRYGHPKRFDFSLLAVETAYPPNLE